MRKRKRFETFYVRRDAGLPDVLLKSMSLIGSVWMAFLLYMVMLLLVFDVARCFVPNMKHSLLYALSLTICILGYGYFNYKHPKVQQSQTKVIGRFVGIDGPDSTFNSP